MNETAAPFRPAARAARSRRAALVAAAVSLLWAAIATPLTALDKVVFAYRPEITSPDVIIAIEEGYFEEAGLETEIVTWNGGMETLPLLAQGRIDFMPTGIFSVADVNLISRGARVRLVAARSMHTTGRCDYRSFVARNELLDSGRLHDLASIKGLRVSTSRTQTDYYYWATLLEEAGLEFDDVVVNGAAAASLPVALSHDLVDVGVPGEPTLSQALATGKARIWIPVSRILPNRQNSFLLFGPNLLDQRPAVGRKVVAALQKAVTQYLDPARYERNVEIFARHTRAPADVVRAMCWPGWSPDGVIDLPGLEKFERWAHSEGFIDTVVPAEGLIDRRFLPSSP
jgi:ABC-type nitrate/sulfonate/bicarbonate transport system substrate-binding protein